MKKWERIAAAFLAFIGGGAAALAYRMGLGTMHYPGPGFFPFWLAAILALVSFLFFLTRVGIDPQPVSLWTKQPWIRPVLAAIVMFIYTFLIDWTGFFSATFLLFLSWLILIEREKWLTVGLVSILGTTGLYLVFTIFLKVPLPKGILF